MNNNLHIERIWLANNLRNYNYIAVCKQSGEAFVIDPYAVDEILATIKSNHWNVKAVINTHDHGDHIEGNAQIIKATGAPLYAPTGARIADVQHWINEGDEINLGQDIVFSVLDTSGHTLPHISLLSNTTDADLLCGDTIFNAGAGNVYSGSAQTLFHTFEDKISPLNDNVKIYPGHDYMQSNLAFTLSIEPENQVAKDLLDQANQRQPEDQIITNIGQEKKVNTFLRLDKESVVNHIINTFPKTAPNPSRETVFLKLRELRNQW